jgi:hypothetical protein
MNLLSPLASAAAVALLFACVAAVWWWRAGRERRPPALPKEWSLAARPVFTADERRVYRSLREALPHHVVLAKLPLVRFCQPVNPDEISYWYELLGSIHITFAVCSPNGRVLAAIDLDTERGSSRRVTQIKQAVLGACRVRYLRCPVDHLPSIAELQLLVPQNGQPVRAPQPGYVAPPAAAEPLSASRDAPAEPERSKPDTRSSKRDLWQDSSLFQDSFFAADASREHTPSSFGALGPGRSAQRPEPGSFVSGSRRSSGAIPPASVEAAMARRQAALQDGAASRAGASTAAGESRAATLEQR